MKKLSMLLIIALLVVAGIMSTMAYNTTIANSQGSFRIINTNQILLEIQANKKYAVQGACVEKYGILHFSLVKVVCDNKDSVPVLYKYYFEDAFNIRNKTEDNVELKIELTDKLLDYYQLGWIMITDANGDLIVPTGQTQNATVIN